MQDTREKILIIGASVKDQHFADDVLSGLSDSPKHIPSRYFYDETGDQIFKEIMELEEYYPTACERDIFNTYKTDFLKAANGENFTLVDLGAGDAAKTRILLRHFVEGNAQFSYAPIDISLVILEQLATSLGEEYPALKVQAVNAEYFDALEWLRQNESAQKLVLFMGGNIGNFRKAEALDFLRRMKEVLHPGDILLIGIDLRKDPLTILRAYDDTKGVTARFNFNLLERINRELGGDFNLDYWKHYATYDPQSGEVLSFLISQTKQEVHIRALNRTFFIEPYEAIHTEYACKYSLAEIEKLGQESGFEIIRHFFDSRHYFTDSLWRVGK